MTMRLVPRYRTPGCRCKRGLALNAASRGSSMERDHDERWRDLCELAAREQDRQKLQALLLELTKLIEKEINARQRKNAA
jgi:hypothetical protein